MVAVIAGIVALVVVLAVLFGVPRVAGDGSGVAHWPDLLAGLDRGVQGWLARSRLLDLALGIVTIVILAAAISIVQDPSVIGEGGPIVADILGLLGLAGLFATAYLGVRRAGLSSAEAVFIGATLSGVVLLLLVSFLLMN